MKVQELRDKLLDFPGHWPVHVAVKAHTGWLARAGGDTDYLYTLDCVQDNFPSQGNMAVILINEEPT